MKVSREQVADNRQRILEAAARLFRERGFEGVTVAQIMAAAGLTHGAFYGHFASKEDLIAQSFAHVLFSGNEGSGNASIADYARGYLSTAHRDDPGSGCLFAALGTEAARADGPARQALTEAMRRQFERFSQSAPGATPEARRRVAIAGWSTMIGAAILARIADDPALSDEILRESLEALRAGER